MKIKTWLSVGLLALVSTGANAAPTNYTLQAIRYDNSFAVNYMLPGSFFGPGGGTLPGLCTSCGVSTAVEDGFGNVSITGAAWSVNGFGQNYNNSFNATTTLGTGVVLTKSARSCFQVFGSFCSGNLSGLGGVNVWDEFLAQDQTTFSQFATTDVYVAGTELYVSRSAALSEANTSAQTYTLIYSTVPVPADTCR